MYTQSHTSIHIPIVFFKKDRITLKKKKKK